MIGLPASLSSRKGGTIASLIRIGLPVILAGTVLAGCTLSGSGLKDASVDAVTTSALPQDRQTPEQADLSSDRLTVQNAVSSADMAELAQTDLSWANSSTGSSGVVTRISETVSNGVPCRTFQTTRLSFTGIGIFNGEICRADGGIWWTRRFDPI